jgi:hypothetical protein
VWIAEVLYILAIWHLLDGGRSLPVYHKSLGCTKEAKSAMNKEPAKEAMKNGDQDLFGSLILS